MQIHKLFLPKKLFFLFICERIIRIFFIKIKKINKKWAYFLLLVIFFAGFSINLNQIKADDLVKSIPIDLDFIDLGAPQDAESLVAKIMKFLLLSIAVLALLGIAGGGLVLITAMGSDSQIQYGKEILKYSLIGLTVTLCAYLIVTLVQTILYSLGT